MTNNINTSSANNQTSVNIASTNALSQIGITTPQNYYDGLSKQWAIGEGLVQNLDHSSKTYAQQSKESANEAEVYERSVIEKYNSFIDVSNQAESEIQTLRDESISELSNAKNSGITDINNALNENLEEAKASIEEKKANAIEEIETLSNETLSDIKAQGIESRANLDLSNLSEVGEKHFLNKSQITNCITEIPQRIKLELQDGNLVLKAGSEVIVPNGFEADGITPKFDYVTVESDLSGFSWLGASVIRHHVFFQSNEKSIDCSDITKTTSGTSFPTSPINGTVCYRTDLNKVYVYRPSTASWLDGHSLPVALCTSSGTAGKLGSIDQVFNGIGYIGSTLWVDKDVKGLYPNGRNEDGTLNNIEINTTKLTTTTNPFGATPTPNSCMALTTSGSVGVMFRYIESNVEPITPYTSWYNPTTNKLLSAGGTAGQWEEQNGIPIASLDWTYVANPKTNTFTSLVPKQPFRAVDYNDKPEISGWAMPSKKYITITRGASSATYIAPANGYFIHQGSFSSNGGYILLDNLNSKLTSQGYGNASMACHIYIPVKKGDEVRATYKESTSGAIYFTYAEGEV